MRAGSRSRADRKFGFSHIKAHTSAVNPITIRINPGIPSKPKRRSSLSNQAIAGRKWRMHSRLRNQMDVVGCELEHWQCRHRLIEKRIYESDAKPHSTPNGLGAKS